LKANNVTKENDSNLQETVTKLEQQLKEQLQRYAILEKEQEELLVELANYEIEANTLKAQLSQ
jgi:regulator of replication initiation timing